MRTEIRIAGFGGQGVALAGVILGKALTIYSDYEAVMTQSYGPEARGGASSANLIISDEPIDYPFVLKPDILVALSQEAYTLYRPDAKKTHCLSSKRTSLYPITGIFRIASLPHAWLKDWVGAW